MSEPPESPPEAQLIRLARLAMGKSPEDLAPLTNGAIKASRWRQIEQGYATRQGMRIPTSATAPVLARMAFVVKIAPDRLATTGRLDAVPILEQIYEQEGVAAAAPPRPADDLLRRLLDMWPRLGEYQRQALVGLANEMLEGASGQSRPPGTQESRRRTG